VGCCESDAELTQRIGLVLTDGPRAEKPLSWTPSRSHLSQRITARKAPHGIWFRRKCVDTETLPRCIGISLLAKELVVHSHHTSLSLMSGTYVAFPWKESLGQQCGNVVEGRGIKHCLLSQPC